MVAERLTGVESQIHEPEITPQTAFEILDPIFSSQRAKDSLDNAFLKPRGSKERSLLAAGRINVTGEDCLEYTLVNSNIVDTRQVETSYMIRRQRRSGPKIFWVKVVAFAGPDSYWYTKTGMKGWGGKNENFHGDKEHPNLMALEKMMTLRDNILGKGQT